MMIFERHSNFKYKFGNRHFCAEGYYESTVGLNTAAIQKYIKEQEKEDQIMDKLKTKEYVNPIICEMLLYYFFPIFWCEYYMILA